MADEKANGGQKEPKVYVSGLFADSMDQRSPTKVDLRGAGAAIVYAKPGEKTVWLRSYFMYLVSFYNARPGGHTIKFFVSGRRGKRLLTEATPEEVVGDETSAGWIKIELGFPPDLHFFHVEVDDVERLVLPISVLDAPTTPKGSKLRP